MTTTIDEQLFQDELELFRQECEAASQYLYAYPAIRRVAQQSPRVSRALDRRALFWNTVSSALQLSALITLARVFDQGTPHNIDVLVGLAQRGRALFLKPSLARRKCQGGPPPSWLNEFVAEAYEPTPQDFRQLRAHVDKARRIYHARYRDLRTRVFAHTLAHGETEVAPITSQANIHELKRLISSLLSLHAALFGLFWDGRPPTIRRLRFSAKPLKDVGRNDRPHERIVAEVEQVWRSLSGRFGDDGSAPGRDTSSRLLPLQVRSRLAILLRRR